MPFEYEQKLVAYIDILGFSNFIKNANKDPYFDRKREYFYALTEIVEEVIKEAPDIWDEFKKLGFKIEYFHFSDTIIISFSWDNHYDIEQKYFIFSRFLEYLGTLQSLFLPIGLLTRGGIAAGNLYHKNNKMDGDALIDAYLLEKELSIYPRIIIDEDLFLQVIQAPPELKNKLPLLYKISEDSLKYVDFLERFDPKLISKYGIAN